MTGAYCTTSFMAITATTGKIPTDFKLDEMALVADRRRGKTNLSKKAIENQLMQRHGAFKTYLHEHGKTDEDTCECGEVDTPTHSLLECLEHEQFRTNLRQAIEEEELEWPTNLKTLIENPKTCLELRILAKKIILERNL
ncbi:hypothetical protein J6590_091729 [Homalodisca vitripennis]|nr:hypothetical protein J6590_091729 [Homalodisca vitripennis]